jgi:four helix bundle protein
MTADELKQRTKQFALEVMKLCDALPNTRSANVIANQLLRSGTSVGANYRAACRARSDPDFISKIGITLEESDESVFWLELIRDSGMKREQEVSNLLREGNELISIFVASSNTTRRRIASQRDKKQI